MSEVVRYRFPKPTLDSILGLVEDIINPIVAYSHDQDKMALEVIEQDQAKARQIRSLLAVVYEENEDG